MKGPLIVTGCQRSGTCIVTHILAEEYNLSVLGDRDLHATYGDLSKLKLLLDNNLTNFIVQMPSALLMYVDMFHTYPDLHFVGVMRDTEEIIDSMKRIEWQKNTYYHWIDYMYDHVKMMKSNWCALKEILPDTSWTEVQYNSFSEHPLFIPKEKRMKFTPNQWNLE
tara:strand:- start:120 stop:617 length:498 start_codon:yes stop_codon:yes gene_type:complete